MVTNKLVNGINNILHVTEAGNQRVNGANKPSCNFLPRPLLFAFKFPGSEPSLGEGRAEAGPLGSSSGRFSEKSFPCCQLDGSVVILEVPHATDLGLGTKLAKPPGAPRSWFLGPQPGRGVQRPSKRLPRLLVLWRRRGRTPTGYLSAPNVTPAAGG